ncbi:hypothetical protein OFO03_04770 [Campylobacter sp. JMF_02 ED1]|uniref:hypothetical protein n=1 Tax=unclassified Campylobacter TaxID=2593542 RepID=UPI0022E9E77A|nr:MULTISPECIES: hypothetical protein [unclassified Campylobacter]MDA3049369.1 hypothetical protein [Campylobacter sp. JMF_15 NE4]MDA3051203.1 hypothetical protein [Campylobacter sp. JMF_02 ED1]
MKKEILKIYLIFDFLVLALGGLLCAFGAKFAPFFASSQLGFFCSLAVVFFSHRAYALRLEDEIRSGKYDKIANDEFDDENLAKPKKSAVKSNFATAFFSPFKILSYLALIFGIWLLAKFNLLNPLALMLGVSVIPLGTLVFVFCNKE